MPLDLSRTEWLGTQKDMRPSERFCHYCLKGGDYTVDYSMDMMIDVWVKYLDKYNEYSGTNYTAEQLRRVLRQRLPGLERWSHKSETQNAHYGMVSRVQAYINTRLFENIDIAGVASTAGMSESHFRRVFKSLTGESPSGYIHRLRMEYIAHKLLSSDNTISEILSRLPLYNASSMAKSFRNYFGLTLTEYRKRYSHAYCRGKGAMPAFKDPEIVNFPGSRICALQVGNSYRAGKSYAELFSLLSDLAYRTPTADASPRFVSISQDDPMITSGDKCRFYIGVVSAGPQRCGEPFVPFDIPAGKYALFRHQGPPAALPDVYRFIYMQWLPGSGYVQREPMTFEIYGRPADASGELDTNIYIPIENIKH